MGTTMRDWESTEPNPDEEHLKALWEEEIKDVQFIEPLPESLLLNALADNVQN